MFFTTVVLIVHWSFAAAEDETTFTLEMLEITELLDETVEALVITEM